MKIKKCRLCKNDKLSFLFSLGELSFTGKFSKNAKINIPKKTVSLVICDKCKLVQLSQNFNPKYLYGKDYGYRTGINSTMTNHVRNIVYEAQKLSKIKKGEFVLDIASNDGTMLNFYQKDLITVGIDPILSKFNKFYKNINFKVSNFFSLDVLKKNKLFKKYKIISALSVFYDVKAPNNFLKDIKKILHIDGIFILEHADLLSIVKNNLFDTICHEHLEYYSTKVIVNMMNKNDLRVFNLKKNNINGGSIRYYISHSNSRYKVNNKKISSVIKEENRMKLEKISTYKSFLKKIDKQKNKLNNFLNAMLKQKKIIHGYGASTKGNVLLQYFKINKDQINFIADRNPKKNNFYTPGTKIKIISEKKSRKMNPDFYLVLPWHFRDEILKRETKMIRKGTRFIFPLPKLKVS
ncbi:class I SAM-dependent methyltransferase [Candidatus Pelagibacter sp.]|nr:class I SAM-dependent methyltransferase [Candidatus Pelagibacter sp.]